MMKIDSTTLSMDALSSHKEMATTVTNFTGLTSWQKFLREDRIQSHFSLHPGVLQPESASDKTSRSAGQSQEGEDAAQSCREKKLIKEEKDDSFVQRRDVTAGCSVSARKNASLLQSGFMQHSTVECSSMLDFSSCGRVQTVDGRTIDFSLDFSAYEEVKTKQTQYVFTDPLVLAVDDEVSSLSDAVFAFDLDGDGHKESISSLSSGSGFLALDKNGDGVINNGSELFGPQSGSGYDELREYDVDGNLWIDENDPIFSELKIWIGAGGKDSRLVSLKEAGVGALCLAHVGTVFDMRGKNGELLGRMERSGLYLKENGEVKSMAEIDLTQTSTPEEIIPGRFQAGEEGVEDPLLRALRTAIVRLEALLAGRQKEAIVLENKQRITTIQQDVSLRSRFWHWQQEQLAG